MENREYLRLLARVMLVDDLPVILSKAVVTVRHRRTLELNALLKLVRRAHVEHLVEGGLRQIETGSIEEIR